MTDVIRDEPDRLREETDATQVVIVGAGFAGLTAAKKLKHAAVDVTVIDRYNHHLFQPLLYQVATAGLSPGEISHPIRSILAKQSNAQVLMGDVVGVDLQAKFVELPDRSIPFDYLIVATGAAYNYFGHDEWKKRAPALKTIEDATTIRKQILLAFERAEMTDDPAMRERFLTFIVVGAGPTGVEMAGAIAELAHRALASDFRHINPRSARILLVEAGPRVLAPFREDLSDKARQELERLGVEVHTGTMVEELHDTGVIANGEDIEAETIIWAAGVRASPAAEWLGAESDRVGRVIVEPDLSLPGHSWCFVVGDTAYALDEKGHALPGLAPVAIQQGKYVGDLIRNRVAGKTTPEPFRYLDKGNLATVGRAFAVAQYKGFGFAGLWAWFLWIWVHVFYLIDFQNRVLVLIQWFWGYVSYHRGARIITCSARSEPRTRPPPEE